MQTETLADTDWDVVIEGTGLPQSLLALALSRSGKKVLHVDCNEYYGGNEASLGLTEAEVWANKHADSRSAGSPFSHAILKKPEEADIVKLGRPRAYELSLAPQLLYSRSALLGVVVSSQIHNQLDFQAVGSWFVVDTTSNTLVAVPGSREDVFRDDKIDMRAKRALMKLLRSLNTDDSCQESLSDPDVAFTIHLEQKFGLPTALHSPLLALTMSLQPPQSITTGHAVPRVIRHLRSIGVHAPGCPALLQRYGGLAEIIQVACRANAVGGGVYVLGTGISKVEAANEDKLNIALSTGDRVVTRWLVGAEANHRDEVLEQRTDQQISKSISIVASPLSALFQPLAAGAVTPAGSVVLVAGETDSDPPVYIFAHASDSGECLSGQSILYASVALSQETGFARLERAVAILLQSVCADPVPELLWSLQYQQDFASCRKREQQDEHLINLRPLSSELVLEDGVLEDVKAAWMRIAGSDNPGKFMKFEAREGTTDNDDDGYA